MLPNVLTVLRIILTPVFILCLFYEAPWAKPTALGVFIVASITDAWDGYLARKRKEVTRTGTFLDPLADKILVSSAFLSFAIMGKIPYWMVALIIFRDLFVTGLRMLFLSRGVSLVTSRIAKLKTTTQLVAIVFILSTMTLKALKLVDAREIIDFIESVHLIYYAVLFVTVFTLYSGLSYLYANRAAIRVFIKTQSDLR
ncbi:MAG: CDP-diacylglycerol--glycerol-3-phosphate 3-phosphatidyltransferase [Fidelibacterota bacterium]